MAVSAARDGPPSIIESVAAASNRAQNGLKDGNFLVLFLRASGSVWDRGAPLRRSAMTGTLTNFVAFERIFRTNTYPLPLRKNSVCGGRITGNFAFARIFCD
jgi:hypothetical protein